jgi:hypothetical protein
MEILNEIAAVIARHVSKDGFQATPIERLTLVRSSTVTMPMPNVYRPQLCLVAQGRKEVTLGDHVFRYAPGRYGVVTYELPAIGHVVEATPDMPYLCLYLDFDPVMLGDLALRVPPPPGAPSPPIGKTVSDAGAGLLDAALRLLRLLDDPAALPVLGPLAEQEILYHLLAGPDGARMRHITSSQGSGGAGRPRHRLDREELPGTVQHRTACRRSRHESVEPARAFSRRDCDDAAAIPEAAKAAGRAQPNAGR